MKARILAILSKKITIQILENFEILDANFEGSRNKGENFFVGDYVEVKKNINALYITKVLPRKNLLQRPKISNIDFALITISVANPKLDTFLLDKLITQFNINNINSIIIFTKCDLLDEKSNKIIEEYINDRFDVLKINKYIDNSKQFDYLKNKIKNKYGVITGLSGVGKSTFLNLIDPKLNLLTQEISKKLSRGKQTTRTSYSYEIFDNTFITDTPGFSNFNLLGNYSIHEVIHNFYNFEKYMNKCKFKDCMHINETGCFIKENVNKRTYNNYLKIINDYKNDKKS